MGVVIYWGGRWGSQRSQRARVHQGCRTTAGGGGGGAVGCLQAGPAIRSLMSRSRGPLQVFFGRFWFLEMEGSEANPRLVQATAGFSSPPHSPPREDWELGWIS